MTEKKIHASPTKDFFIRMITRDISLEDCILDLLDNSIDGTRRAIKKDGTDPGSKNAYDGFSAVVKFSGDAFTISDNCGGISIEDAMDYAFHFGKRPSDPHSKDDGSIGLYGIGMKRAIFKIGEVISIKSSTRTECFSTDIDVESWSKDDDWDFVLGDNCTIDKVGTDISIGKVRRDIADEFEDPTFEIELRRIIARDYSIFLQKGFDVLVNGKRVKPYPYRFLKSEDFSPVRIEYKDETEVNVEIIAGLGAPPPDDPNPDGDLKDAAYWGWYVVCNDRVVLAADKSSDTIWGDGFPGWHPQYNGFLGMVFFTADDPWKLPWTTTKRDVELTHGAYRRAIVRMQEATRPYLDYTNARKADKDRAKEKESEAKATPVATVDYAPRRMVLPVLSNKSKVRLTTISYQKPADLVLRVKDALGSPSLSNKDVGIKTFEAFCESEGVE